MGHKHSKFRKGQHKGDDKPQPPASGGGQSDNRAAADGAAAAPTAHHRGSAKPTVPHQEFAIRGLMRDFYHIDPKVLGKGQYGEVHRGLHKKTNELFAIKRIIKARVRRPHILRREMEFLLRVNHPNVINVVDLIEDDHALHIVQEFCSGGELFARILKHDHGFQEQEAARITQQILAGIAHCHDEVGIVHRDLKPENILFKTKEPDSDVVIIDFGLSGTINPGDAIGHIVNDSAEDHSDHLKTRVGTPYYIAPEVFTRDYGRACDLWSIGVIVYILLCGYPPFSGATEVEIMNNVRHGGEVEFPNEDWENISEEAIDLIRQLLNRHPDQRPTAAAALEHPWFGVTHTADLSLYQRIGPRLEIFHHMSKLKKMASMVIVDKVQSEEVEKMRAIFEGIDTDKTGSLTLHELEEAFRDRPISSQPLEELFEGLDMDGTQEVNYNEFLAAVVSPTVRLDEANIRTAFDFFDTDKSGYITVDDMARIAGSAEHARLLIGEADFKHNNRISWEEFVMLMKMPEHKKLLGSGAMTEERLVTLANNWHNSTEAQKQVLERSLSCEGKPLGMDLAQVELSENTMINFVSQVDVDSPADFAEIAPGDVLLEVDGEPVASKTAQQIAHSIKQKVHAGNTFVLKLGTIPADPTFQAMRRGASTLREARSFKFSVSGAEESLLEDPGAMADAKSAMEMPSTSGEDQILEEPGSQP